MLTPRHQHVIALAFLGLFVVAVAWVGFDIALVGAMMFIVLVLAYGHTFYLMVVQRRAASRPVTVETGRLVQRDSRAAAVATIDLTAPFTAECVHDGSEWVLYKVRQGPTSMWISVPGDADGVLVRALGLSWPPRGTSGARYL